LQQPHQFISDLLPLDPFGQLPRDNVDLHTGEISIGEAERLANLPFKAVALRRRPIAGRDADAKAAPRGQPIVDAEQLSHEPFAIASHPLEVAAGSKSIRL
jgi:hypothetical protein